MGKSLGDHILLVSMWIEAFFTLTIPEFEGLHTDILICSYKMYGKGSY